MLLRIIILVLIAIDLYASEMSCTDRLKLVKELVDDSYVDYNAYRVISSCNTLERATYHIAKFNKGCETDSKGFKEISESAKVLFLKQCLTSPY